MSSNRKARRKPRARRSILTGLLLFATVHLALVGVLLFRPLEICDPVFAARLERLQQLQGEQEGGAYTVVVLGSSRPQWGVRALQLASRLSSPGRPVVVGNFGHPGGGAVRTLLQWRRLERAGVRPDLLLVEVTPLHLVPLLSQFEINEQMMPASSLARSDLPVVSGYLSPRVESMWCATQLGLPCWTHREFLVSRALPQLLPFSVRWNNAPVKPEPGLFPGEVSMRNFTEQDRQKWTEISRVRYTPHLRPFRIDPVAQQATEELLADCLRNRVPVQLVLMPESPTCRGWYPAETEGVLGEFLGRLHQEFGAELLDTRSWLGDERQFFDSHHLIEDGAKRFTDRLAEVLAERLSRSRPGIQAAAHSLRRGRRREVMRASVQPVRSSRQRQRERARGAVIGGGLALLLAHLVVLGIFLFQPKQTWRICDPVFAAKIERLQQRQKEAGEDVPTVVFLGSSRLQWGIRAERFGRRAGCVAANFGHPGSGPLGNLLVWQRLQQANIRVDRVVVEILPTALHSARLDPNCWPVSTLTPADLVLCAAEGLAGPNREWVQTQVLSPWWTHRERILYGVFPNLLPQVVRWQRWRDPDPRLFPGELNQPPCRPEKRARAVRRDVATIRRLIEQFHIGTDSIRCTRTLLASACEAGIPVTLVLAPESPVFRSWYTPEGEAQLQRHLAELQREYGVSVIDARNWLDANDYFADTHHLLGSAAEKFTDRLAGALRSPPTCGLGRR